MRREMVTFRLDERALRFVLVLPRRDERRFTHDDKQPPFAHLHVRPTAAATALWTQQVKELWRALLVAIKGKLLNYTTGIESFEEAFAPQIIIPDGSGRTVGDIIIPQIQRMYETNQAPSLIPSNRPSLSRPETTIYLEGPQGSSCTPG